VKLTTDQANILALQCLAIRTAEATGAARRGVRSMQWLVDMTMATLADNDFELAEMRAQVKARMAALANGKTKKGAA
jgi:hypothetical protein